MDSQNEQNFSQIIDESIEAILSGEATLETVLAKYPEQADLLRAEIETALWLIGRSDEVAPRVGFIPASRKRVVERIQLESGSRTNGKRASLGFVLPLNIGVQLVSIFTIFLLLFLGSTGAVSASQSAVPGDSLYPVKRLSEQVTYTFTTKKDKQAELSLEFSERRLNEVDVLMARGQYEKIDETLIDFERDVRRAVILLREATKEEPQVVEEKLMETVQGEINNQTSRLETLLSYAPVENKAEFQKALETSQESSTVVEEVIRQVVPSPTPFRTRTSAALPTQTVSPTARPTRTQVRNTQPAVDEEPAPSATATTVVFINPVPSNTPRPTNTPIPTSTLLPTETVATVETGQPSLDVTPTPTKGNNGNGPRNTSEPNTTPTVKGNNGNGPPPKDTPDPNATPTERGNNGNGPPPKDTPDPNVTPTDRGNNGNGPPPKDTPDPNGTPTVPGNNGNGPPPKDTRTPLPTETLNSQPNVEETTSFVPTDTAAPPITATPTPTNTATPTSIFTRTPFPSVTPTPNYLSLGTSDPTSGD